MFTVKLFLKKENLEENPLELKKKKKMRKEMAVKNWIKGIEIHSKELSRWKRNRRKIRNLKLRLNLKVDQNITYPKESFMFPKTKPETFS